MRETARAIGRDPWTILNAFAITFADLRPTAETY
jgi:hypothetical protein